MSENSPEPPNGSPIGREKDDCRKRHEIQIDDNHKANRIQLEINAQD